MGVVIGSPRSVPPAPARRPARWRWLPRGAGALLASAAVHAVAAATVGGVLALGPRGDQRSAELVDLDLTTTVEGAPGAPTPAGVPGLPAPAEPVRAHLAPRRRASLRPAPAAAVAQVAAPLAAVEPSPAQAPRFAMSAGTVAPRATLLRADFQQRAGGATAAASADTDGEAALGEGDVNEPARLVTPSPLVYPAAARAAAIELDLPVEIVVDRTGRVSAARALRHAGYGLDEEALRAIHEYRFSPAKRAGRAVPVRMRWTVQFRLR